MRDCGRQRSTLHPGGAARKNWIASSQVLLAMTLMTMLHPPPSYPRRRVRYPVSSEFSLPSLTPRNTGSSAFADDDQLRSSRGTMRPSFANRFAPIRRAQGRPGARCTRGLACQDAHSKTHTNIKVQRRQSGLPSAIVLRLISCSPRRDRACLPPSSLRSLLLKNLTPATGASGPHDYILAFGETRRN
jgi:hypothetical protein